MTLHEGGPCAVSDLARRVQLSRPAMTTMVDRLLARGWVDRSAHAGDRRKVIISLTERFPDELYSASRAWRQRLANLASAHDDWQDITRVLADVAGICRRSADELAIESRSAVRHPVP
jgi:DNA-binding MarR family transcriptional regulator